MEGDLGLFFQGAVRWNLLGSIHSALFIVVLQLGIVKEGLGIGKHFEIKMPVFRYPKT